MASSRAITADEVNEHYRLLPWFRYASGWPDEERCEMVWLLAHAMLALHDACLVGDPAPRVRRMYERMVDPQPGDVVLETSSVWRPNWPERALGRLVRRTGPNSYRGEFVVESLYYDDHPETTWENARFIALPVDESMFLGERGRVVFTRDPLVAALADKGIEVKR